MNSKFECQICFEEYEYNENNNIIVNGLETRNKRIICSNEDCKIEICTECLIHHFKQNNIFSCPKCKHEYNISFLYNNFDEEQINTHLSEILQNKFIIIEKGIIDETIAIKYKVLTIYNQIFESIFNACDEELKKGCLKIFEDEGRFRYKDLSIRQIEKMKKDEEQLINKLEEEIKNRLNTMFETITYFQNGDSNIINNENVMLSESKISLIYEFYPNMKLLVTKESFIEAMRCFYSFVNYFILTDNTYGIKPYTDVFLFLVTAYERIDNINNKFVIYLKNFERKCNEGYEKQNNIATAESSLVSDPKVYTVLSTENIFREHSILPGKAWGNQIYPFRLLKLLLSYIDISSINVKSFLKRKKYMSCSNKRCDGNCYQYDEQIRCEKCGAIYCDKCLQRIYPEYINVPEDVDIIKVLNPDFKNYTPEQKKLHVCNKEDLDTVKLIFYGDVKHCPKCGELIYKDGGCNDMGCLNPACNARFDWKTMKLVATNTNETLNRLAHERGLQQPRFDHPDAQRLRARGASIKDIISKHFDKKSHKRIINAIDSVHRLETINFNDTILDDERLKYAFDLTDEDIEFSKFYKYAPKNDVLSYEYQEPSVLNNYTLNEEEQKIVDMKPNLKKNLIEQRFKNKIFNIHIQKYFYDSYNSYINELKTNIDDTIYKIEEDTFDNISKDINEYISIITSLIISYNNKTSSLKKYYPKINYTLINLP